MKVERKWEQGDRERYKGGGQHQSVYENSRMKPIALYANLKTELKVHGGGHAWWHIPLIIALRAEASEISVNSRLAWSCRKF